MTGRLLFLLILACSAALPAQGAAAWGEGALRARSWADASGTASFDRARAAFEAAQGRPAGDRDVMPFGPRRAVWYRLELPSVSSPLRAVLTLPAPGIDRVEIFLPTATGDWEVQRAGDSLPVVRWPVRYLHPAFPLTLDPVETGRIAYARVQHSHPVSISWVLRDASSFNEASKSWHLLLGGYLGFMALVLVLAGVHALLWRDVIHLYFGGHVILVGLVVLALTGLAGEYLWPRHAWWNDLAAVALSAAALGWIGLFLRELAGERGRRSLSWVLLAQSAASFAFVLAFVLVGREPVFLPYNVFAVPSLLLFLGVAAWYAFRRPEVGVWVLAGFAVLAAGAVFPLLRNLGLEPAVFGTKYGLQLGAALEIPLVLVGLYFRSRERRDNHIRVQALARTDPLTGLGSHRVLVERLQQLLERHRRDPARGALLRVRVGNLASIANEYGREAAEAAMVRAAECVVRQAREEDTVAREQGGDLLLLLEGRTTREQASAAGRDMIASGLKFSERLPPGVTLYLQVAGACAPLPPGNPQLLLGLLGQMLQDIERDPGGRAMRIVRGPQASDTGRAAPIPPPAAS